MRRQSDADRGPKRVAAHRPGLGERIRLLQHMSIDPPTRVRWRAPGRCEGLRCGPRWWCRCSRCKRHGPGGRRRHTGAPQLFRNPRSTAEEVGRTPRIVSSLSLDICSRHPLKCQCRGLESSLSDVAQLAFRSGCRSASQIEPSSRNISPRLAQIQRRYFKFGRG